MGSPHPPPPGGLELALKRFLSGAVSATLIAALLQPLDVVKTTQQSARMRGAPAEGALHTALRLRARDGLARGLWAGLSPTVTRVFFGAGIYFASLHALSDALGGGGGGAAFASGVGARALAALALSPVSVVKTRMEDGGGGAALARLGTRGALAHVARTEGVASLYSGLLPTLMRDAPFSGIYFSVFTALKGAWRGGGGGGGGGLAAGGPWADAAGTFLAGLAAGALATAATHPADVLKTRRQLRPAGGKFVDGRAMVREAAALLRAEGGAGLFAGLLPRVAKRAGTTALTWTLFDVAMRRLGVEVAPLRGGG